MEPLLLHDDRLLVSRFAPRCRGIRRGAIVLVRERPGSHPESIKRVVGLPGERLSFSGAGVFVDGVALAEPYLPLHAAAHGSSPAAEAGTDPGAHAWQLGANEYFVLGDNRTHSTDSRTYGPVRRAEIIGVAWYRYAPPQRRRRLAESQHLSLRPARRW